MDGGGAGVEIHELAWNFFKGGRVTSFIRECRFRYKKGGAVRVEIHE